MKLKAVISMMLSVLILSLGGCGTTSSNVDNSNNNISNIEKEKAVKIVKNSFERYFDLKIDSKKIIDSTKYMDSNEYWITMWTDAEANVEYYACLTKNGKIKGISYKNNKESSSILDKEEAKKISVEFIKKHFADNDEEIKLTGIGNLGDVDFTYGEDEKTGGNKAIYIGIDNENKKVCSFTLEVEQTQNTQSENGEVNTNESNGTDLSNVKNIGYETTRDEKLEEAIHKTMPEYDKEAYGPVKYYYNKVDLNGDGKEEVFTVLYGMYVSGSGGGSGLLFDNNYNLVSTFTLVRTPIIISNNKTNGWNDILMYVSGGGIESFYAQMKFDGKTYPSNPSVQPEVKPGTKVEGKAIIANEITFDTGIELN